MDVNILNDWGVALKQVRKPEEALAVWEKAARWNPSRADIHHNLGIAYHELSRVADAINQYKLAIASDPEDMIARYNLGIAYVHKGQFDLAEQTFNELLALDPENTDAKAALEAVAKRRADTEALEGEQTPDDSSDEEDQDEN
jgi:tetratricopeptide (TPR) repeat protein